MKSKKSAASLEQQKPHSFKRGRLLKRGCSHEPLSRKHIPYLWAAYARGSFDEAKLFREGLTVDQFTAGIEIATAQQLAAGGDIFVFIAKTASGEMPIGLVSYDRIVRRGMTPVYAPHAIWFPEASGRNKTECVAEFLIWLKRSGLVLIYSEAKNVKFFLHLCKYGILRPVGKIRGWFADNADCHLFQGVN